MTPNPQDALLQPPVALSVRPAEARDVDRMVAIYSEIERRSGEAAFEGDSVTEVAERLRYWVVDAPHTICRVCPAEGRVDAFAICLQRGPTDVILENFCLAPEARGGWRKHGVTGHPGEILFRELVAELAARGNETMLTSVHEDYYDYRRHLRFLEYRGFARGACFQEMEYDLTGDGHRR